MEPPYRASGAGRISPATYFSRPKISLCAYAEYGSQPTTRRADGRSVGGNVGTDLGGKHVRTNMAPE